MGYFVYKIKTTGRRIFECKAPSLADADQQYKNEFGVDPKIQIHIEVCSYESYGHGFLNCLEN